MNKLGNNLIQQWQIEIRNQKIVLLRKFVVGISEMLAKEVRENNVRTKTKLIGFLEELID